MSDAKKPRTAIDWEAVEMHYRAGIRSLKDIGKEYGVSDAGILKRAKKDGWERNLSARIQAKAEAKVSAAAVSELVSVARAANEQAVVEANAELQYRIRMEHRQDIGRARRLFQALLGEIENVSTAEGQSLIESLAAALNTEDDEDRAKRIRQAIDRVCGMTGRVDNAKKLVEMLEKLVRMEREAFGIKDEGSGGNSVDDLLLKLGRGEL